MATETSKPEPWRFCAICDPESERPFSVERAYIKHLSSQRHLRKTSQPLKAFYCPDCGKHFSRNTEVQRHLINGRCSGPPSSRLITDNTSASTKKHALSVSPNGVPWKINKTAACTTDATVGSPLHLASRVAVDHDTHQSPSPVIPHVTISPDIQTSCASTDENESESWIFEAHDAIRDVSKVPTTDPEEVEPSLHYRKEVDQWLSDAMMSASLKDDALAHVRVRPVISSTPIASLGSLGSLFLLRTPKVSTPRFSFPSLHFAEVLAKSFARSAEMPAPMLTELVGDDRFMAEISQRSTMKVVPQSSSTAVPIIRPEFISLGPHLTRTASVVNDYVSVSSQSAENPPSTSGYVLQLVDSTPNAVFRPACDDIDDHIEEFLEYVKNGKKLLHCAGTGDALGLYAILMEESRVDINYLDVHDHYRFSEIRHPETALMVAARTGHYSVMYALLKASAFRSKHRLDLSVRNHIGETAMSLAAHQQSGTHWSPALCEKHYLPFRQFLRTLVAILCCECFDETHAGDANASTTWQTEIARPELGTGDCQWCQKLWVPDWPGPYDVEEINKCVQEARAPLTDAKVALLMTNVWTTVAHWETGSIGSDHVIDGPTSDTSTK
jgi:hypothetical protein